MFSRNDVPTGDAPVVIIACAPGSSTTPCTLLTMPMMKTGAAWGIYMRVPDTALCKDQPASPTGEELLPDASSCTYSAAGFASVAASPENTTLPIYGEGLPNDRACEAGVGVSAGTLSSSDARLYSSACVAYSEISGPLVDVADCHGKRMNEPRPFSPKMSPIGLLNVLAVRLAAATPPVRNQKMMRPIIKTMTDVMRTFFIMVPL